MHGNRFTLYSEEPGRDTLSRITWPLLKRVLSCARPHIKLTVLLLAVILAGTALGLITPLLFRELIDHAIPQGDVQRLNLLALALLGIPVVNGLMGKHRHFAHRLERDLRPSRRPLLPPPAHVAVFFHPQQGGRSS